MREQLVQERKGGGSRKRQREDSAEEESDNVESECGSEDSLANDLSRWE